jgi:predicted nucleic acid-binding protein
MSGDVFVDTNVLVYNRDASEPEKQPRAAAWLELLWQSGRGALSAQVLQEYYVTVTRKLSPGMPIEEARDEVRDYASWAPLPITADLIERAFEVETRFGLSWWDAVVVAAAQTLGCRRLLTEDLQDGMDFDGVVVLDPFAHSADLD